MSWAYFMCDAAALSNDGDFVLLQIPGHLPKEVAACNVGGRVFVFDNICPHRGARIFKRAHGNMPLRCPYHGYDAAQIMEGAKKVEHRWDASGLVVYLDKKSGADL